MTGSIGNLFSAAGFSQALSTLVIVLEFVYILIAFIITREVSLMNKSFTTDVARLFTLIAYAHFFGAAALLIFSLFLL